MSDYRNLLHVIKSRVYENLSMSHSAYYPGSMQGNQLRKRTVLTYVLEIILHQHRQKYATIFNPLEGKAALHHLIFMKTKWRPSEIRDLKLEDALFVIQDELRLENISDEAQEALSSFNFPSVAFLFEDFPVEDWNYRENSAFLRNLMMKATR